MKYQKLIKKSVIIALIVTVLAATFCMWWKKDTRFLTLSKKINLFGNKDKNLPTPSKTVRKEVLEKDLDNEKTFSFELLANLPKGVNAVFSPISIRLGLGMALAGANGKTADDIARALQLDSPENSHDIFATTLRSFYEDSKKSSYKLSIANSLWGPQGYSYGQDFANLLKSRYASSFHVLDSRDSPEQNRLKINQWVSENTVGKIPDMIPPGGVDNILRLFLLNAVYFEGKWENEFKEWETREEPFFLSETDSTPVRMMHRSSESYRYAHIDKAQVIELPYLKDESSMILVLPDEKMGLEKFEKDWSKLKMKENLENLLWQKVDLKLPNFEVTTSFDLKASLSAMGMRSAFNQELADFSKLTTSQKLYLDKVIHRAYLCVDEKGTVAAAVTASEFVEASANIEEEIKIFHVDHPFLFFILDKKHGHILFMGRVVDPTK